MKTLIIFGRLFWNNDRFRSQDYADLKIHKFHPKPVYFRESHSISWTRRIVVHVEFRSVKIWLTCFSTKSWGFIRKADALSASKPQGGSWAPRLPFSASFPHGVEKGASDRPVPQHLLFGHSFGCCEGFASVQEDRCHLWGDFSTAGNVCHQFLAPHIVRGRGSEFGWQVSVLEFPSPSKPFLQGMERGNGCMASHITTFSFESSL